MNYVKGLFIFICLIMISGCNNKAKQEVGNDWRTTGIISSSGTIDNNEEEVYVLVEIKEDSAAFYRDSFDQVLFDSVAYPNSIEDAKVSFESISFKDQNGDLQSDVVLDFIHADNSQTHLVWYWDEDERYLYQEDLSYEHKKIYSIEDYIGVWKLNQEDLELVINTDFSWYYNNHEETGSITFFDEGIILYCNQTGQELVLRMDFNNDLVDNETGYFFTKID